MVYDQLQHQHQQQQQQHHGVSFVRPMAANGHKDSSVYTQQYLVSNSAILRAVVPAILSIRNS